MTPIAHPTLAFADVAFDPQYALGFPAYVGLTIAGVPQEASFARVPYVGWEGTHGMVGVTLSPAGSDQVLFRSDPDARAEADLGVPLGPLRPGEKRRMLADLTEVLPPSLEQGVYDVVVRFGPAVLRAESSRLRIAFRAPTALERAELAVVDSERSARGSWGQWTTLPPLDRAKLRSPWGPDDPLRLNAIVRELLHGPLALRDIPLGRLDVLGGLFSPEAETIRAELLAARGDAQALAVQTARVRQSYPGLAWWMAAISDGESAIAWARGHRLT